MRDNIDANLKIDHRQVSDLIPYARNARTHSDEQVAQIAASIREFGFLVPVLVDADNGIVAGHGRVLAARKLGMESVPTIEAAHLSETQKRAYILADNKLTLNAGWDDDLLRLELIDLGEAGFDLELTGFDLGEIESLTIDNVPESSSQEIDPDGYEMNTRCPRCGFEFDDPKA